MEISELAQLYRKGLIAWEEAIDQTVSEFDRQQSTITEDKRYLALLAVDNLIDSLRTLNV